MQPQPCQHVFQPDAVAGIRPQGTAPQYRIHLLRRHAAAVVLHFQAKEIPLPGRLDHQLAQLVPHVRKAMVQGVLHNGLQGQPGQAAAAAIFGHIVAHLKAVCIADAHDVQVAVQHLQFLVHRVKAGAATERAGYDIAQRLGHTAGAVVPRHLGHEADGVEGVHNEMGVDLTLQDLHLGLMLALLGFLVDGQHVFQAQDHLVEGGSQPLQLLVTRGLQLYGQVVGGHPVHGPGRLLHRHDDGVQEVPGEQEEEQQQAEHHPTSSAPIPRMRSMTSPSSTKVAMRQPAKGTCRRMNR